MTPRSRARPQSAIMGVFPRTLLTRAACPKGPPPETSQAIHFMAQYVYTMRRVGKVVPPKRVILKDISLSFFPGAKIGVLGLNGSGKSSLLRIMAGEDTEYRGEAQLAPGATVGILEQEPQFDPEKDVRGNVEDGVTELRGLLDRFNELAANYSDETADEFARLQEQID